MVKNGVVYEGDTLRQTWPMERELPRQYWQQ